MTRERYDEIAAYVHECMTDAAHDEEHVRRVLGYALAIAEHESGVDFDLLITACMMHDIGRAAQFRDPTLDHAAVGAEMARDWLAAHGYTSEFAEGVRRAIRTHRYRTDEPAESLEAKILFDADKLDATGICGLFRTVSYKAHVDEPYYTVGDDGLVDFRADAATSVTQEYLKKLAKLCDRFYTDSARELALERDRYARRVMNLFVGEMNSALAGVKNIDNYLS